MSDHLHMIPKARLFRSSRSRPRYAGHDARIIGMWVVGVLLCCVNARVGYGQLPSQRVSGSPSCATCTISLEKVVSFGSEGDEALLTLHSVPYRDERGRTYMWTAEKAKIGVYDNAGKLIRTVGSPGAGPGEFEFPGLQIFAGRADSLYVVQLRSIHVFSPEYRYARKVPFTGKVFGNFLSLPTGEIVAPLSIRAPDLAGLPLHILRADGQEKRTLPARDASLDPRCPSCMVRHLARASGRPAFWSLRQDTHAFEEWSYQGRLLRAFTVVGLPWFPESVSADIRSGVVRLGPDTPALLGGWEDSLTGHLWVVGLSPRGSGAQNSIAGPGRSVRLSDSAILAMDAQSSTIIEVIDLNRRVVLASQRVNGKYGVSGSNLLYSRRQDPNGIVHIDVWRPVLKQSTIHGGR